MMTLPWSGLVFGVVRFAGAIALAVSVVAPGAAEEAPAAKPDVKTAGQADKRLPAPPAAVLAEPERQIKEVFKDEYQKKAATDRIELAKRLLKLAEESRNDGLTYYVALREARDVAASAGDLGTAMAAADLLSSSFVVDAAEMKANALVLASRAVATPEAVEKVFGQGMDTLEQAVKEAQYDSAAKLLTTLEDLARRSGKSELVTTVQTRSKDIRAQQAGWSKVKPAFDKLKANPDDPEAALTVARYHLGLRADWEQALPLLAKCSAPALKAAAAKDLAKPEDPAGRADAGDLWWSASEKETGAFKDMLQDRAASWYGQALGELTGLRKAQAEKHMQTAARAGSSSAGAATLSTLSYKDGKIRQLKVEDEVRGLCFHPNGRQGLAIGPTGLHLYDLETGKETNTFATRGQALCWDLSADGNHLLAAGAWGTDRSAEAKVWDVATGTEQGHFSPPTTPKSGRFIVKTVTFFPGGPIVLGYYYEEEIVKMFQMSDGKALGGRLQSYAATTIWSNDSSVLLQGYCPSSSSYPGPRYHWLRILDGHTGKELREIKDMSGVTGVALYGFSPDARLVFASGDGVTTTTGLRIFDVASGKLVQNIQFDADKQGGAIKCLVVFPDNRRIAAGCQTGKIIIWDIASGKVVKELASEEYMWRLAISPDSRFLVAGGEHSIYLFGVAH
ncbi:MAG: hypothetical protein NTW87_27035 [Planctomycetota bacterium]|nr:hypothetical protein [Planctomycetota bacterium]